MRKRSFRRPGRLVPSTASLRSRTVRLSARGVMPWHSTRQREELLLVIEGAVRVERRGVNRHPRAVSLPNGFCLFLPPRTWHQVVNAATRPAVYIYVTGS